MALRRGARSIGASIGAVLALVQNTTWLEVVCQYWGVTENGIVTVPKICTGAVLDLFSKVTCLYYTEKNS